MGEGRIGEACPEGPRLPPASDPSEGRRNNISLLLGRYKFGFFLYLKIYEKAQLYDCYIYNLQ